jgi:hypothetical protein
MVFADSRGGIGTRSITLSETSVAGAVMTDSGLAFSDRYSYQDSLGDTGFLVVTATFTNDADFKDAISFEAFDGATSTGLQLNAYQLRSVPEPSSTALLGLGGLALILRRRK